PVSKNQKKKEWIRHSILVLDQKNPTCSRRPEKSDKRSVRGKNSMLPQPSRNVSSHHHLGHKQSTKPPTPRPTSPRLPPTPPPLPADRTCPPRTGPRARKATLHP
uniref:Uncharacterized protein n=1 Tax=Peromyscus maniculatus bairdii TaxID=230844 RepID=A0A8C8UBL7_PERMB